MTDETFLINNVEVDKNSLTEKSQYIITLLQEAEEEYNQAVRDLDKKKVCFDTLTNLLKQEIEETAKNQEK